MLRRNRKSREDGRWVHEALPAEKADNLSSSGSEANYGACLVNGVRKVCID
jgi:hypothetical protein